jgi:RNA polymerase sigma-70 factor (ECF subfamily)
MLILLGQLQKCEHFLYGRVRLTLLLPGEEKEEEGAVLIAETLGEVRAATACADAAAASRLTPANVQVEMAGACFRRWGRRTGADDRDPRVLAAVDRAKAGDPEALRFLYSTYADSVFGFILSIVRDVHDAEDVTQQVFLKLMTSLVKYEPREVPFAAWMLRVARNVAVDHLRKRRAVPCEDILDVNVTVDERSDDCRRLLHEALATLPRDQRDVVILRHLVGLSPGQIAKRMDKTEAAIHGLHHRGRKALRDELTRLDAAPTTA